MRAKEFTVEQLLIELDMGPIHLQKLASKIQGALCGMEFEMYVPNAKTSDDDYNGGDSEPDFSSDQSSNDFEDIEKFFSANDGTMDNNSRNVSRLMALLESRYEDWLNEKREESWQISGKSLLADYIKDNRIFDMGDAISDALDGMKLTDDEKAAARKAGRLAQGSQGHSNSLEIQKFDAYINWKYAVGDAKKALDEVVDKAWDEEDESYFEAQTEYNDGYENPPQGLFLREAGLRYMSNVQEEFANLINWPYWTEDESFSNQVSIDDIAGEFENVIKRNVHFSDRYHGGVRDKVSYTVEPDASLDSPQDPQDGGIEFISPPLSIDEMFKDLDIVKKWAGLQGCYTNDSTGLHINISIPNLDEKSLDYVKLAILLGDQYVLSQFDRFSNTYAKSSLQSIKNNASMKSDADITAMLDAMKGGLAKLASHAVHSGNTGKYVSINNKEGYVEFRSPGGDWLDEHFDKIKLTTLRMVVALDAACDPQKYRKEYLTKLYKILAPESEGDAIRYFAQYAAGDLPKGALHSFIQQLQATRKSNREIAAAGGNPLGRHWVFNVTLTGSNGSIEVVATSAKDAIEIARKEWGLTSQNDRMQYHPDDHFQARPLRKFQEPTAAEPEVAQPWEPETPAAATSAPANGESRWAVLGPDGRFVFDITIPGHSQGDANAEVARLIRQQAPADRMQGPFEVVPAGRAWP